MTLTIARAESEADIADCLALRWDVFVTEQGVAEADELDGTDVGCVHVLARYGDTPVGAARYHATADHVSIGRVCVVSDMRRRGYGRDMIRFICRAGALKSASLSAQVDALEFYRQLGFIPEGEVYLDAGIAHQSMTLVL
ncbi:MAG: GNAT family N-acetyltransferase [Paracoccaceae bacterium]